ncbi:STAS domain-containing protein [Nocardioides sp.]|uniref:STAS domain-containing protein n=1 Tax=Nocardioides sp. TaxID=35761 RepID=UPI001A29B973|nr:STAS domain-containing protein [Nocardioides sp.]MBJ7357246.1 STAS domain-containing protein [Nocardioides sp.]
MDFSLTLDVSPPDVFVRPCGELDVFSAHQLSRDLHDAVDEGCRRVLLDLADVTFVDAGALGVLDRLRTQMAELGGSLVVVDWSPRFLQVCRMAGLDRTFELAEPMPA